MQLHHFNYVKTIIHAVISSIHNNMHIGLQTIRYSINTKSKQNNSFDLVQTPTIVAKTQ